VIMASRERERPEKLKPTPVAQTWFNELCFSVADNVDFADAKR